NLLQHVYLFFFKIPTMIRRLPPPSSKTVPPRCSHHLAGGAIEALASRHHHFAGVGLLVFSVGSSFGFSELFSGELLSRFVLFRRDLVLFMFRGMFRRLLVVLFVGCFSGDELLLFMLCGFCFASSPPRADVGTSVFLVVDGVGGAAGLLHSGGGFDSVVVRRFDGAGVGMGWWWPEVSLYLVDLYRVGVDCLEAVCELRLICPSCAET
ncbi:hypothetical protein A2U01_0010708, partial [Trifolium medium]|nr:hypothetical protein [Trifolium medium]